MKVKTRFAPSPTGFLHIGGARTAIFNYLFAQHHKGEYYLRVEDTDKERSTVEAKQAILDGLEWLGLRHDGEIVYQSQHEAEHKNVAYELLEKGQAYRCFHTPDELEAKRSESKSQGGRPIRSDWRDKPESEHPDGQPYVIRLKAPTEGKTVIRDLIQGDVTIDNSQLDDMVLLRGDSSPTYMLAVVVDDHRMGITHVIRGDDHLTNAARQILIFEAMGWKVPDFAHISLMHGADGGKLSKRHGALSVLEYKTQGILPDALFNYLLRMGWSHGDDEIISRTQAIEWFGLDAVGRSPSMFDMNKLLHLNHHYMQIADSSYLIDELNDLGANIPIDHEKRMKDALPLLLPRTKTLCELMEQSKFLYTDHVEKDEASQKLFSDSGVYERLALLAEKLARSDTWDKETLEMLVNQFVDDQGLKFKDVGLPLRAAIVGRTNSPSILDLMAIMGKEEILRRLPPAKKHTLVAGR